MIPILYESTETSFTSNGLGRLRDCISCIVTEERNGVYEVKFEYPVTGAHYEDIIEGRIIAVTHDATGDIQPFDIYKRTAPIDGVVTFNAKHISYRLNGYVVKPFTASSCSGALGSIRSNVVGENSFTFETNKSVSGTFKLTTPTSVRAMLGGEEGSILDVYGTGEYKWDKFNVFLYVNRGSNKGVEIRYGKNLTDLTRELDFSEAHNGIVPYWKNTKTNSSGQETVELVTLPEWAIYSSTQPYDGRNTVFAVDMTQNFTSKPTVNELRTAATDFLSTTAPYLPSDNITIDFVQLYQTEEYKDIASLQAVCLCDYVTVYFPTLGIDNIEVEVIRVTYNVLLDRYDEVELGDPKDTFYQVITSGISQEITDLSNTVDEKIDGIRYATMMDTQYCLSSSRSTFIQYGSWQTTPPDYVSGYFYWKRSVTYYSDGTVEYGDPVYDMSTQASIEADIAAANAASAAQTAQGIASNALSAAGEKRRVFNSTPTPPYDLNDIWFDGTHGYTYLCTTAQSSGSFSSSDWTLYSTDVSNYFWHDSSGAHVSDTQGTVASGNSQTIAANGTVMMRNGKLVTSWTGTSSSDAALNFYDCTSASARDADLVASYARAGITNYINNKRAMALTASGLTFYDPTDGQTLEAIFGSDGVQLFSGGVQNANFSSTSVQIGKTTGDNVLINTDGLTIRKNGTTVGALSQVTGYTPEYTSGTYNNALFLKTPEYFAVRLDSSVPYGSMTDAHPVIETDGHDVSITLGQTSSSFESSVLWMTNSNNGGSSGFPLVDLQNPGVSRSHKGGWFRVSNESHGIRFGLSQAGNVRGIYDEATTEYVIAIDSNDEIVSRQIYNKTTSTGSNVRVESDGRLKRYVSSSRRYKEQIEELVGSEVDAERLYDARVVQFQYRDDYLDSKDQRYNKVVPGFIAEELAEVYPIAVNYADEQPEDWEPKFLIPPMLKLIQEQHKQIEALTERIEALERSIK